jgi:SAM-dependent methyltransferase
MNFIKKIASKLREVWPKKMLRNPAGERNKQPVLEVLQKYIDDVPSNLLEISSGPGLHSSFFAGFFPNLTIQPSEFDTAMFQSIKAYRDSSNVTNVLDPIFIDISQNLQQWDAKYQSKNLRDCQNSFEFMLNMNMIHISPFSCTEGLFANAAKLLKPGGLLFTYGPYAVDGVLEPESNVSFDQSLRSRNLSWGIRDIADLKKLAAANSIELLAIHNLPSNNKCLVWKKNQ